MGCSHSETEERRIEQRDKDAVLKQEEPERERNSKAIDECDTKHADPIPESLNDKLYNSIVRIEITEKGRRATGFFMKIKINNKEMKFLFT
jgi:hypothetical protein